jgi:hypothetical protein
MLLTPGLASNRARRKGKELISALSKKNRKVMDEKIKFLRYAMKNCELYMRDYEAGQQTALKPSRVPGTGRSSVPAGSTTGTVTVTMPSGVLKSNVAFRVAGTPPKAFKLGRSNEARD